MTCFDEAVKDWFIERDQSSEEDQRKLDGLRMPVLPRLYLYWLVLRTKLETLFGRPPDDHREGGAGRSAWENHSQHRLSDV